MDPQFTRPFRISIVGRARCIEDLVIEQAGGGVSQYVILGAGFAAAEHVSADDLARRYFAGRPDGLRPPRNAEELLVATTG
jgi:hypothetical protein